MWCAMSPDELERWIRLLIARGRVHDFYISTAWVHTRDEMFLEHHRECQMCKAKGRYKRADVVHHIKPLRRYPRLALTKTNLMCLCDSCHWDVHHSRRETTVERW